MPDTAERPFRWEDLDQRLLSPKLQDLAEEMQKRALGAERKAAFDTRQSGNSAGYLPRLFELQREVADEWAKRLYDVHCEVWRIQGHSISADFIHAVSNKAIPELILSRKGAVQFGVQLWCTSLVIVTHSNGAPQKREARTEERKVIEMARAGKLADSRAPKRLFEAVQRYLEDKAIRCSPRTHELERERLSMVRKFFGDMRIASITPAEIQRYQQERKNNGTANRTINMDVGALSRVLKHFGLWRTIEERVKQLPETAPPLGRALTYEQQHKLLEVASCNPDWEPVYLAAVLAANTSLRPVEVKHLQWKNVDLIGGLIRVTRSKNQSSHRVIPLNQSARKALTRLRSGAEIMGFAHSEHYVWYAMQWGHLDPTSPVKKWDTAWRNLRAKAGLPRLRFHDLRHTIITELAEAVFPIT